MENNAVTFWIGYNHSTVLAIILWHWRRKVMLYDYFETNSLIRKDFYYKILKKDEIQSSGPKTPESICMDKSNWGTGSGNIQYPT